MAGAMTAARPVWQSNDECKLCEKCNRPFSFIVRRHHCRGCGLVVCDKCSGHRVVLPESYNYGPSKQRVCDSCYVTAVTVDYEHGLEQGTVVPPNFEEIRVELLERVRAYLKLDTGWTPEIDLDGVRVSSCAVEGSSLLCVRNKFLIKAPMKKVMEVYANMEVWKNWNPYVSSRLIEQVDPLSRVMTAVYEFPIIDRRDICFFSAIMDTSYVDPSSSSVGLTVGTISVDHPLCPIERGIVRSNMLMSLSQLEPVQGGDHTLFTSVVHSDPKGLLPPFVVNAFINRGADHLRGMANYIEKTAQ